MNGLNNIDIHQESNETFQTDMPNESTDGALPETVETLLDWTLINSDQPFNDEEFLGEFESHAKKANTLFDKAFAGSDFV